MPAQRDPVRKALRDLVLAQRAIVRELREANRASKLRLAFDRAQAELQLQQQEKLLEIFARPPKAPEPIYG